MSFAYRVDGGAGVEGWIDASKARGWALEAQREYRAARGAATVAELKAALRRGNAALNRATAALNLPDRQGAGAPDEGFPFGMGRVDLLAGDEARARTLAAATVAAGGLDRVEAWALALPDGDTWFTTPDGWRWAVRVYPYPGTGERTYALLPDPAAVLAWRRALPETGTEARAREIALDPWSAYVSRRRDIDATNARYAGYWGLTSPEQIQGFQVAADVVSATMGAEWEARQRAAVQAKANEMLDNVAAGAAASVVGAPIAAVLQALKLLTGVLPWVTEAPPPPALARLRSGGVGPSERERPTHTVPEPPAAPLEAAGLVLSGTLTGTAPVPSSTVKGGLVPGLRRLPNASPEAVASLLGGASSSAALASSATGATRAAPVAPSSAGSVAPVVVAAGLTAAALYVLTR